MEFYQSSPKKLRGNGCRCWCCWKKKYWNYAVGHGTSDRQKLEESEPENIHIAINPRWALGGSADFNQQQRLPIPEDRRKTSAVWVGTAIFWLFWSERRVEKGAIWKGGAGSRRQMQRAICPMLSSHRRDPEAGIVYVSVCGLGEGRGTHRHGILGLNIALFCG